MSDTPQAQAEDRRAQIRAEKIVREHGSTDCRGHFVPELPFCSCAPEGQPLCDSCRKLCDAIAAELSRLSRVEQALRTLIVKWREETAAVGPMEDYFADGVDRCADELEAAISASPEAQPEDRR